MLHLNNRLCRRWTAAAAFVASSLCASAAPGGTTGYALDFDGDGDYVTMGQAPGLGTATFTLEGWVVLLGPGQTASSGSGGVVGIPLITKGRGEADGNNLDANYFLAVRSSDNVLAADFEDVASGLNHPVAGSTPLQAGVWHHVAATYDGTTWRLYLDGGLEAELAVGATPRFDSVQHFGLATALSSTGAPSGYLDGLLDEARVWDHARTQQEIMDNMGVEIASAPGLLGRWSLNEGMGSTAGDSTGNGNDGSIVNATWVPGYNFEGGGTGLFFDGSDSYVTMGTAPGLGSATFTLEAWLLRLGAGQTTTSGTGGVVGVPLVTKGRGEADGDNRDANYFLAIRSSDNVLAADFEDVASGLNHPVAGTTPIGEGVWHHVAATYDGTTWRLYLDGALEAELAVGATPRFDSIQHFGLATALSSTGAPDGFFDGVLDEVRVWDHARSEQEVMDNMGAEIEAAPGLVGRWGLNEGSGSIAGDSSGNGHNGTIMSAAWVPGQQFANVLDVQTVEAITLSDTEAQLNGNLTSLGSETEASVYFRWGTAPDALDMTTPGQALTMPGTFSETLGGLVPDSVYYVQAVAEGLAETDEGAVLPFVVTDNFGLVLNGTTDYVTMGEALGLGSEVFTLELWFKRTGTGQDGNSGAGGFFGVPLIAKGRGEVDGNNLDANYFFAIRSSDNVLGADFEDTATGLNHPVFGTTPIQLDTWYHAAAVYDGSTWRLYLNGALEAELAVGATPRFDSIQHFGLGTALNSTGVPEGRFEGTIDEARVWHVARTQSEIQQTINQEVASATGLVGRWGLNEGSGATAVDSTGGHDGTVVGGTWGLGAPFDVNLAPDLPVLVAPPDGGVVDTIDVELAVSVSDPEADALDVSFFGRAVGAAPADPFTIIALPDTQFYSESFPANFEAQTQWVLDNAAAMNIAFVTHLGDIVETASVTQEWTNADAAISILDANPDLPYGLVVGNHDQDPNGDPAGTGNFNTYFPVSRYENMPWYGGHYGTNNDNHYILFSASGMDFIAMHLEYDLSANPDVLAWADSVLQSHADRRAIVCSHYLIEAGNPASFGVQGAAVYDALKGNANLFLMMCGHIIGEGRRVDVFDGSTVHTLLADYQNRPNGGNGWLRILEFVPADDAIDVFTYSPVLDQFETDADSEFTIAYQMGGPFEPIGTVTGVPSGTEASLVWQDLARDGAYEWFATVSDGGSTVSGPQWSFTIELTPGDLDGDGMVGVTDFLALLAAWGPCEVPCPPSCPADLNGDCVVGTDDFLMLLANWG